MDVSTPLGEVWQSVVALRDDWTDEAHRGLCQELGHIADRIQDVHEVEVRGISYPWACRVYDLIWAFNTQLTERNGVLDEHPAALAADILRLAVAPLLRVPVNTEHFPHKFDMELGKVIVHGALRERPYLVHLSPGQSILAELSDKSATNGNCAKLRVAKWVRWSAPSRPEHSSYGVVDAEGRERYVAAHRLWDYNAEMNETTKALLRAKLGQHGIMELFCGTNPKDYPWGPGDNDNYGNVCSTCGNQYRGPKHSAVCAECQTIHKEWWQSLSPAEQEKHQQEAMAELQKLLDERKGKNHVQHT